MSERIHVTTCPLFDDTADVVTQTCTVRFALDLAHVVALREGEGRDAGRTVAFLAGDVPLPGAVCYGRGACRCRVEFVEDAEAYARLTNQTARIAA